IAARDGVRDGLICVFKCVEPCWTFDIHRNRERKELELQGKMSKCLFLYHYYQHPEFGAMYGRVQTWFPFAMQIGINGREWLTRQLQKEGLSYRRYDNKVTWVENLSRAQQLLDAQLQVNWPEQLEAIRRLIHPAHPAARALSWRDEDHAHTSAGGRVTATCGERERHQDIQRAGVHSRGDHYEPAPRFQSVPDQGKRSGWAARLEAATQGRGGDAP